MNAPLLERSLEEFRATKPAVMYSDGRNQNIGIAAKFEIENEKLTIFFEFVIVDGRMMREHTAHFSTPLLLEEGDVLRLAHAGGTLEITNLAQNKYRALQAEAQAKK